MKALLALCLFTAIFSGSHAFAQQIPNMQGNYAVIPGQCNFVGIDNIATATVTNMNSANGQVIVLTLVGKKTGEVGFQTQPSRMPNPALQAGSDIQFIDTDVSVSQVAIAITNTIHDEYQNGQKNLEAVISLILNGPQLEFIANEGTGTQESCKFMRTQ